MNILTIGPNDRPNDSGGCNDGEHAKCDFIRVSRFGSGHSSAVWSKCNVVRCAIVESASLM